MSDHPTLHVKISVLGARGVGKTSMIAAMSDHFGMVFPDPELQLIPSAQTGGDLQNLLIKLKQVASGERGVYIDTGKYGLEGTMNREEHELSLVHPPTGTEMSLKWIDYPGGWLEDKPGEVGKMLEDSAIILTAIDAPALMEHEDAEHEAINRPASIKAALQRAFKGQPKLPRLILFVPVRGERWLAGRGDGSLGARFHERHAPALNAVNGFPDSVASVYCPIQTLGSVHFTHYEGAVPMFERDGDRYTPADCDQPLGYILAFLLHQMRTHAQQRSAKAKSAVDARHPVEFIWDSFWKLFGFPSEKEKVLEQWKGQATKMLDLLAKYIPGCKKHPPFEVLQNPRLLGM